MRENRAHGVTGQSGREGVGCGVRKAQLLHLPASWPEKHSKVLTHLTFISHL